MKPMISVIIPAYNAGGTVKKSVESALNQTVPDYEVILIEDGSVDDTPSILEELARNYPAMKVLKQSHKGAGAARNAGIEAARGDYLYFADADDLMHENAIETMQDSLEKNPCDLLTFGFRKINLKKNSAEDISSPAVSMEANTVRSDFTGFGENGAVKVIGSCWNKVFKKSVITENNICFPEDLKRNEEEVFIMRYLDRIDTICNIPDILYDFYPIDMEKALRVMAADFATDVTVFAGERLDFASLWKCDGDKTRNFIASEFWGKMMLALRLDKKRDDFDQFREDAALLMEGLKKIGTIPGTIKKSKTYLLLKVHMLKQVYHSL